ncbi:methyltransferase [Belliella sp. R4-6]|uniref:tRNA1(Val) (adenine(37)-N6)-methyltransferase n=1 Tax=Belliella alkalica TaxID=1730871 RepID=A0ABS9V8M5_9BACT|nr:methyltransferase [Belliella alkalica]MCH7412772.1 methyltransferase [Belliella alkalica]
MKVSTDAVLLGAIAGSGAVVSALDIGVGTGVISLMLAQRFSDLDVVGVELDDEAFIQASENAKSSKFSNRITFHQGYFQDFSKNNTAKFDLIVTNPPYFPDHIKTKDLQRNKALHNDSLPFGELVQGAVPLLERSGAFWLILPPRQMQDFQTLCLDEGLFPFHQVNVRDKAGSKVIRVVQAFSFDQRDMISKDLHIKNDDGTYAMAYRELLKDFLIIF